MDPFSLELAKIREATLKSYPHLRWLFLGSLFCMLLYTTYRMEIPYSISFVWVIFFALVISNLFIHFVLSPGTLLSIHAGSLIVIDTLSLTVILSQTGASYNPFTILFLPLLVISAALLSLMWTITISIISIFGFGALFLVPQEFYGAHLHHSHNLHMLHIEGMWVAFILTVVVISYYLFTIAQQRTSSTKKVAEGNLLKLHQERLLSLTTLTAGVAHELSTPLGTIALVAGELNQRTDLPETIKQDLSLISNEIQRSKGIIEAMGIQTANLRGESPGEFSPEQFYSQLKSMLSEQFQERFFMEQDSDLKTLFLPQNTLLSIFISLVRNSFDAGAKAVSLNIKRATNHIEFYLKDNGSGMSSEVLKRATDPFFTTKKTGEGMGLGLFLVQLTVERLKGTLRIESSSKIGSSVYISIPLER